MTVNVPSQPPKSKAGRHKQQNICKSEDTQSSRPEKQTEQPETTPKTQTPIEKHLARYVTKETK